MTPTLFPRLSRVLIALASLVLVAALGSAMPAHAESGTYKAPLSGSEEVPANDSLATGVAVFMLDRSGEALHYKLNVANIENVTASHIHLAPAGSNGGVVAFLYGGPTTEGRTQGTLATGTITADDLVGALAGQSLDALLAEMDAGGAYVNVHTSQIPGGEIRGQIR